MNLAQWVGERDLRGDPFWSPMPTPFPDFEGGHPIAPLAEVLRTFNCGHPKSAVNTACYRAGKYWAERCRECARQRNTEYRLRLQQQRPDPLDVDSLVRVVALGMMPCSVAELRVAAFCGKARAAAVLRALVMDGLAAEQTAKFCRTWGAQFVRTASAVVPDESGLNAARKTLRSRGGHRGRLPKVADGGE